jgi:cellulose synthase/poly-beta-1,6-N-acetylglucosamine synthase-like glycosyltransferase
MILAALTIWVVLALPSLMMSAYLLVLTLFSYAASAPPPARERLRFDIVVPAHDEAGTIEGVLASLALLDWPKEAYRVLVVADNCADATALIARNLGAHVLERWDPLRRGKGYALALAFQESIHFGWARAVVVVDADSKVSANLLDAIATRLESGSDAVQVHHGVLNAQDSWRTRLMTIAFTCFHRLRSRARERLHLSCGIRGNGWCVTHKLLSEIPFEAHSLAEDIEFGIQLGLAGYRVHYADEAWVNALMVSSDAAASTQRERWERGRLELIRTRLFPLLRRAARQRSAVCLDLALDLLIAPLSYLVLLDVALLLLAAFARIAEPRLAISFGPGIACGLCIVLYVMRGWQMSGIGLIGLIDLFHVPSFILWKVLLILRAHDSAEWVRTKRELP